MLKWRSWEAEEASTLHKELYATEEWRPLRVGESDVPREKPTNWLSSTEPICIRSIQTEEVDFRNIYEYMHVITVIEKGGHESESEQGGGTWGYRGRKWKGEHDIIMYNIKR